MKFNLLPNTLRHFRPEKITAFVVEMDVAGTLQLIQLGLDCPVGGVDRDAMLLHDLGGGLVMARDLGVGDSLCGISGMGVELAQTNSLAR
ncbi:hypothetical protein Pan97_14640 [Bremerella volcania]|uniref:Uncharacterized protein n=1 Tax=Bremerella volcania TaxID=2527984 RepID=A0A518C5F7_9BACT|nr:hypothetical protein [Bremerella volcania]QDU74456.1 hypothetical protein Pan97_14640 [Bremerella volcania]